MPSQDKAAEILSRFPGPVALAPSRVKWIVILLGCAAFTAAGWFLMPRDAAEAWFVIAFFGLGTLVAFVMLLPGAGGMKLDRDGFEITSLFRRSFVRWQDATGFIAVKIPRAPKTLVVFDDANARVKTLGELNVHLTGRNAGVPDTYGMSAEHLAGLMAQWRERAVSSRGETA